MHKTPVILVSLATAVLAPAFAPAQELGANFNHNPEIIDFQYLEKSTVDWIRTTPRILDYVDGDLDLDTEIGLAKVVEAGERGYQVAFGFRWDFAQRKMRIPDPGSADEMRLFDFAKQMLERIGPHIDMLKLGNEPSLETLAEDKTPGPDGRIPLVVFTRRLLTEVVEPFYAEHPEWKRPEVYVGSLIRLYAPEELSSPSNEALIRLVEETDAIRGLAVHLHVFALEEVETSFRYVRDRMPHKPIIVPEFSLQRLYKEKLTESIGATSLGRAFAKKYGRDPAWELHQWYSLANSQGVSQAEWLDLLVSRGWYPAHYLRAYFMYFEKYGVALATYPLLQQYSPEVVPPDGSAWFLNPIFCQKSLIREANGEYASNPLCFDDFVALVDAHRLPTGNRKEGNQSDTHSVSSRDSQ